MPSFFRSGDWNFTCELCGATAKAGTAMTSWNGGKVCAHHKDVRNPQDLLRSVAPRSGIPWSRTTIDPHTYCTIAGRSAIPSQSIPGCALPASAGRPNPSAIPHYAWPGIALPGLPY